MFGCAEQNTINKFSAVAENAQHKAFKAMKLGDNHATWAWSAVTPKMPHFGQMPAKWAISSGDFNLRAGWPLISGSAPSTRDVKSTDAMGRIPVARPKIFEAR